MDIHEFQAKEIMRSFGVPTLQGAVAKTAAEAQNQAKKLGGKLWVVKAQIHAGGVGRPVA